MREVHVALTGRGLKPYELPRSDQALRICYYVYSGLTGCNTWAGLGCVRPATGPAVKGFAPHGSCLLQLMSP